MVNGSGGCISVSCAVAKFASGNAAPIINKANTNSDRIASPHKKAIFFSLSSMTVAARDGCTVADLETETPIATQRNVFCLLRDNRTF
jgi:hypothetical protein